MQHYIPSGYAPIDRSQILSRSDPRDDAEKATRRAIVRAAAELAR